MRAVVYRGERDVRVEDVPEPKVVAPGDAVVRVHKTAICGSDLRAIYREHLGEGPEAYQGVVGGHEPSGEVVALGPGVRRLREGDRVVVYHISGCGQCEECRRGYQISCLAPQRAAYGWQRDGGHADFLLAEERDLPPASLAARFASKEAIAKSLGAPVGMRWHDCTVTREVDAAPTVRAVGTVASRMAQLGVARLHLSLSHDAGIASAVVVLES